MVIVLGGLCWRVELCGAQQSRESFERVNDKSDADASESRLTAQAYM